MFFGAAPRLFVLAVVIWKSTAFTIEPQPTPLTAFTRLSTFSTPRVGFTNLVTHDCPDEVYVASPSDVDVVWTTKGTSNRSSNTFSSQPLCLDAQKFLITRDCVDGQWVTPVPNCAHTQPAYDQSNRCPPGMHEVSNRTAIPTRLVCVSVYPADSWSGVCAATGANQTIDTLDASDVQTVIDYVERVENTHSFWLPAKWVQPYSIRWMLPGRFGDIAAVNTEFWSIGQAGSQGLGCLHAHRVGSRLIISNRQCVQEFPMVCVYAEPLALLRLACPEGYATARYVGEQNHCFAAVDGLYMSSTEDRFYRMISAERTLIAREIMATSPSVRPRCIFHAIDYEGNAEMTTSIERWIMFVGYIPYVNWITNATFTTNNAMLVSNADGEWDFVEDANCLLSNRTVDLESPSIRIYRNTAPSTGCWLELIVGNMDYIWHEDHAIGIHCFHRKELFSPESVISITPLALDVNESSDEVCCYSNVFAIADIGDGYYWCEAHAVGSMELLLTPKVYIDVADMFAGSVARKCPCLESLIDIDAWFDAALVESGHSVRFVSIELVRWSRFRIGEIDFIQIWFRASVQSIVDQYIDHDDEELLKIMDHHMLRVWRKQEVLEDILRAGRFYFPVVNSTVYCLPEVQGSSNTLMLLGARINQTRTPTQLCLLDTGLPVVLKCVGNAHDGAHWQYLTESACSAHVVSDVTRELFEINTDFQHAEQIPKRFEQVRLLISNTSNTIASIDIYSISNIMERASRLNDENTLESAAAEDMFSIYDSIMSVNTSITRQSSVLNATNVLLAAFDDLVNNLPTTSNPSQCGNFQTHIIDPEQDNITGLALFKPQSAQYLFANQSIEQLLSHPDLIVATYLPAGLLDHLPHLSKLIVSVFNNDALFQTPTIAQQDIAQTGKIISMSIPNVNTTRLPVPIPIFFKYHDELAMHTAGFWVHDNRRNWVRDGIQLVRNTSTLIQFNVTHLTNFALLIRDGKDVDEVYGQTLFLITIIGSGISLVSIAFIILTACRFASWRARASNQLLVQLSLALALMLILFCVLSTDVIGTNVSICIALGAVLHYLVLVNFMWMLVMAYLQFMRYVIVFIQIRSERYVLKLSCISWAVPLIPVAVVLIVDPRLYVPASLEDVDGEATHNAICYPTGMALMLSLVMPVALILVCNVTIFIVVIYNLLKIQKANRSIVLAQLRVSAFLFFLLGLTWIFGLLSNVDIFSEVSTFLFCLTAALQGFVLFVYFVLLDAGTRKLWTKDLRVRCGIGRRGSMSVETTGNSKQTT